MSCDSIRVTRVDVMSPRSVEVVSADVVYRSGEVALLCIHTKGKRPYLYRAIDNTLSIRDRDREFAHSENPDAYPVEETVISLPEFSGWTVFADGEERWVLNLCLVNE